MSNIHYYEEEKVDIYEYPAPKPRVQKKPDELIPGELNITLGGDLHANPFKLLYTLIREGAVTGISKENYEELFKITQIPPADLTQADWLRYSAILEKMKIDPACKIKITSPGDGVCDRFTGDHFTFKLKEILNEKNPEHKKLEIEEIYGNHDYAFLQWYYNVKKKLVDKKDNPYEFVSTLLPGQERSLHSLCIQLQRGIITIEELDQWVSHYMKHLRLFTLQRGVDAHGEDRLVLKSHTSAGIVTLSQIGHGFASDEKIDIDSSNITADTLQRGYNSAHELLNGPDPDLKILGKLLQRTAVDTATGYVQLAFKKTQEKNKNEAIFWVRQLEKNHPEVYKSWLETLEGNYYKAMLNTAEFNSNVTPSKNIPEDSNTLDINNFIACPFYNLMYNRDLPDPKNDPQPTTILEKTDSEEKHILCFEHGHWGTNKKAGDEPEHVINMDNNLLGKPCSPSIPLNDNSILFLTNKITSMNDNFDQLHISQNEQDESKIDWQFQKKGKERIITGTLPKDSGILDSFNSYNACKKKQEKSAYYQQILQALFDYNPSLSPLSPKDTYAVSYSYDQSLFHHFFAEALSEQATQFEEKAKQLENRMIFSDKPAAEAARALSKTLSENANEIKKSHKENKNLSKQDFKTIKDHCILTLDNAKKPESPLSQHREFGPMLRTATNVVLGMFYLATGGLVFGALHTMGMHSFFDTKAKTDSCTKTEEAVKHLTALGM